jgi:hypothetical protein
VRSESRLYDRGDVLFCYVRQDRGDVAGDSMTIIDFKQGLFKTPLKARYRESSEVANPKFLFISLILLLSSLTAYYQVFAEYRDRDKPRFKRLIYGDIAIREESVSDPLSIAHLQTREDTKVSIRLVSKLMSFANGRRRVLFSLENERKVSLPPIKAGGLFESGLILVRIGRNTRPIRLPIVTTTSHLFEQIGELPEYRDAIEVLERNLASVNLRRATFDAASKQLDRSINDFPSYSELGSGVDFDSETLNSIPFGRKACYRPPYVRWTRWGYGLVKWDRRNPRSLFMLKDENRHSESSNSLRCPLRDAYGSIETYVDGVYYLLGLVKYDKVAKIPDHCMLTIGEKYTNCCCNAAMSVWKGYCTAVKPKELDGWPNTMSLCSGQEQGR